MGSLLEFSALMQAVLAGFLTGDHGEYLLTDSGGRLLVSDNIHTLQYTSDWGTGQHVRVWFDVKADKSSITVWGKGIDDNSPVSETEIVQVLANGQFRSLAKISSDTCSVDWPTISMSPGNNEIMFFMTSAAGRYGATTRLTRPQS